MKNLNLVNLDTDSISVCKPGFESFTKEERTNLLNELNSLYPANIKFEDDGYYKCFVVVKAKNYITLQEEIVDIDSEEEKNAIKNKYKLHQTLGNKRVYRKLKIKGSSLKATSKSVAMKEFIAKVIDSIIEDRKDFVDIYNSYVKEIMNLKDIKRWSKRNTISDKTLNSDRKNESRIRDAIEESDYVEGDRIRTYYKKNEETPLKPGNDMILEENFNNDHCRVRLLKSLHDTAKIFETVLPVKELFINYSLVKNIKQLLEMEKSGNILL